MIKLEKTEVFGWESAIRGMRNPMNSWDKSDSCWCESPCPHPNEVTGCWWSCYDGDLKLYCLGDNDFKLMKSLSKAGSDHAKFLRMINVTVDIIAPLYWWKEADTYAVGVVKNSCSTMHKIHAKEFTLDDFSTDKLFHNEEYLPLHITDGTGISCDFDISSGGVFKMIIVTLNSYRKKYIETKDKKYWWQMIQMLPSSYNQKRTVQLNYQVLKSMYFARKNHKLDEWREFCAWVETLPYFKEICIDV